MNTPIRLVAGLGNPGREYAGTRHNAGFWFVDRLASRLAVSFTSEAKFGGDVLDRAHLHALGDFDIGGNDCCVHDNGILR
jgi:peptidyl-tRNA hydrolase